jgi:hypothetical protein
MIAAIPVDDDAIDGREVEHLSETLGNIAVARERNRSE